MRNLIKKKKNAKVKKKKQIKKSPKKKRNKSKSIKSCLLQQYQKS